MSDSNPHIKYHHLSVHRTANLLNCGMASGLVQAFVFNPWDRALYLSVKNERPFLAIENFREPMNGVTQTVVQRAISSGLYFPLEELFSDALHEYDQTSGKHSRPWLTFLAGTLAGFMNGIVMNPFSRVKYHYWGKIPCGGENFYSISKEIWREGGIRHFFVGTGATVKRDLVFGGTFALLRHEILPYLLDRHSSMEDTGQEIRKSSHFTVNMIAGVLATILSSPLNYVRNIHYSTPPSLDIKSDRQILKDLIRRAIEEQPTRYHQVRFLQHMLRIGWGTARVGCGMAFGARVYDFFASKLV